MISEIAETFEQIIIRAVLVVGFSIGLGLTLLLALAVLGVRWLRRRRRNPDTADESVEEHHYHEAA